MKAEVVVAAAMVVKAAEVEEEEDKNYSDMDSKCVLSTVCYACAALLEVVLNYYTQTLHFEKIPDC